MMMNRMFAAVVFAAIEAAGYAPAPITFDSPAENDRGSMILGNGELGANAWISADGTLHTVLQRSDTWNEGARHVKAGAIDYATGKPVDKGSFRQELSLATGSFNASWRSGGMPVSIHYRIQHGALPFAVCDVEGAPAAEAKVVNWRLYPGGSKIMGCEWPELGNQFSRVNGPDGKPLKFTISADVLVPGGWCHVNRNETVSEMMAYYERWQATDGLGKPDMLSNVAFGGLTRKASAGTRTLFISAVTRFQPCASAADWRSRTAALLDGEGWTADGEAAKRAAHDAAWSEFWNRSGITVVPNARRRKDTPPYRFPYNEKLPVSFGKDSAGGTLFAGRLVVAPGARIGVDGMHFAAVFNTSDVKTNQRLIDNITPGKADGSLVDILDGKLRLLVGGKWIFHPANVPAGRDVEVKVDVSREGKVKMVLDGKTHEASLAAPSLASDETCFAVTRAWAAQRYVTACAGTGALPIRFNGSIFTTSENGDPDYRRWGHGYWWQNTRLPYYPVLAAGDFEVMRPLFRMYAGLTDFHVRRVRKYLGCGGAYFPECMMPWGDHFPFVYGTKYDWKDRPDKLQDGGWHKYEWVGQLELSLMMLDYCAYTGDTAWFKSKALPAIREYLRFFDGFYKTGADGRYHMYPAQAVETWWNCTNAMPEVAGLTRVTDLLLALPEGVLGADDREFFAKVRSRVPELPTRKLKDGGVVFAPGMKFDVHNNVETPELYCVFPFRLCSFEKPNAEIGLRTYPVRFHKHYYGWAQDELNAAYLGLADEAAKHLAKRVLTNSAPGFRWPAYWGPNFDWRPDQCAGGNIQNTLQSMLMQHEGRKIYLLPAWPKAWDCSFKLHAPYGTTVEGRVEDGALASLSVKPESRRADVIVPHARRSGR